MSSDAALTLRAAADHLDALDGLAERKAGLDNLLAQTNREYLAVQERLKQVRAELATAEDVLGSKSHVVDDERNRALKEHADRVAAAQAQLTALNNQIREKERVHAELLASMESLRKRLLGA